MFQVERQKLAGLARQQIAGLFKTAPGAFYEESVEHKLVLLLQAVDRVAVATERPILFAGIVPGFDLVILRNPDRAVLPESEPEQPDPRALSSVDETCLVLLAQACDDYLAREVAKGNTDGVGSFMYPGGDGLYYFAFRSVLRAQILNEMGVSEDGLINASELIESKGGIQ